MVFRVKAGSTALATSPTITPSTGLSNREWRIEAQTICNAAPGGSAATETQGILTLFSGTGTSINYELVNTATTNLATNGALTMQISMQWGTGVTASDTITMRQFIIEGMGP
jgi:hypothetical protein